jgi:hypothetical protein
MTKPISTADGRSPGQHGAVLLRCGTRPLFPLLWIFGGAVLVLWAVLRMIGSHTPNPPLTPLGYVKIGVLLVLGLPAIILGARELRKPTVMFEVTDRGIMVYRSGGMYLRRDLFVPWERIRELRYISYGHPDFRISRTGFGPGSKHQSAIGLKLQMGQNWPPRGTLKDILGVEIKDEIFLDSQSSSPSGRELFDQIQKIRAAVVCGQPDSR